MKCKLQFEKQLSQQYKIIMRQSICQNCYLPKFSNNYNKLFRSLDKNSYSQKSKLFSINSNQSSPNHLKNHLVGISFNKINLQQLKNISLSNQRTNQSNFETKYSKLTKIKSLIPKKRNSLPSINSIRLAIPEKKPTAYKITSKNFISQRAISSRPIQNQGSSLKFYFNKVQGNPNGNIFQFSRLKPTEKYFLRLQNLRLAQKLLLMQPSEQLKKSEHSKFYENHKTYRDHISVGANLSRFKIKGKKHQRIKTQWIQ